ncbi:unnamed protein product [Periconia digitata]|uniref:chitinase n=1 Tax=Periconia digitata TaxID=1303443 RepID=A0A9W4U776_9PLEO|nr:unnamed protein product [Periconia digitata]
MRSTLYLSASAFLALASAQTFTACNPMEKDCPNDPAIAATFETNFKAGKDAVKGWKQTAGELKYGPDGAEFTLAKKGDAPTIQSEGYLHFGYVEVKMKAAAGAGIVSSIVLQSEDLDEVDWEYIGSVPSKVQMNYFGKGNTTTYDRMIEAPISSHLEMHTYALNWTAEAITWIIDDKPVRTLQYAEANGGKNFPQTPSNVRIGIWAGGDSDSPGTVEWAGGKPDYSKAPFTQTVESIKIINYSPGKEYEWTDKTGSYQSIKVIEPGKKEGADVNDKVIAPATGSDSSPPLESSVNKPSGASGSGSSGSKPSGAPAGSSNSTAPIDKPGAGGSSGSGAGGDKSDCGGCEGTLTITMTGTPPPSAPATSSAPVATSSTLPPYPIIKTDSRTPPSVAAPTAPASTGSVVKPTGAPGNSSTPALNVNGASGNAVASTFMALVGAVAMFAL